MSDPGKRAGKGTGPFAVAGHEQTQEDRIQALEDYLGELIELGTLPAPVEEVEEEEAPPA